jgi:hypothetical protein
MDDHEYEDMKSQGWTGLEILQEVTEGKGTFGREKSWLAGFWRKPVERAVGDII